MAGTAEQTLLYRQRDMIDFSMNSAASHTKVMDMSIAQCTNVGVRQGQVWQGAGAVLGTPLRFSAVAGTRCPMFSRQL